MSTAAVRVPATVRGVDVSLAVPPGVTVPWRDRRGQVQPLHVTIVKWEACVAESGAVLESALVFGVVGDSFGPYTTNTGWYGPGCAAELVERAPLADLPVEVPRPPAWWGLVVGEMRGAGEALVRGEVR